MINASTKARPPRGKAAPAVLALVHHQNRCDQSQPDWRDGEILWLFAFGAGDRQDLHRCLGLLLAVAHRDLVPAGRDELRQAVRVAEALILFLCVRMDGEQKQNSGSPVDTNRHVLLRPPDER